MGDNYTSYVDDKRVMGETARVMGENNTSNAERQHKFGGGG